MSDLLSKFFLFILKVEMNDLVVKNDIFKLDKDKSKNLILMMRNNFGRFWNELDSFDYQIQLINFFCENENLNNFLQLGHF